VCQQLFVAIGATTRVEGGLLLGWQILTFQGDTVSSTIYILLVGGLEHFLFSPILGMMIQSD
jgi:hypothetical protein